MDVKKRFEGDRATVFTMIYPIIFIILGVMLIAYKNMDPTTFAYLIGAAAIIVGVSAVANYFVRELYRDFNNYSFSIGILMMAIGVCVMVCAKDISGAIVYIIKACVMLTAIIKIQQAIQLICLKNKMWIPILVISVIIVGFMIFLFINNDMPQIVTYIMLIVDGALSLIINLFMFIFAKKLKKKAAGSIPVQNYSSVPEPVDLSRDMPTDLTTKK